MARGIGDAGDQPAQLVDRVIDGVGDGAGHVLGHLGAHSEIAVCEVADLVEQPQDGVLIRAVLPLAFLGAPAGIVEVNLADEEQRGERKQGDDPKRDDIDTSAFELTLVRGVELLRGPQQRLAVVEKIERRALRVHQALLVAQDVTHCVPVFLEGGFHFSQLAAQLGVADPLDAQWLAALQQPLQDVAEGVGVLAEEKRDLRVDDRFGEHGVGVLRHALCEHHDLSRDRVLARRAAGLHAQR